MMLEACKSVLTECSIFVERAVCFIMFWKEMKFSDVNEKSWMLWCVSRKLECSHEFEKSSSALRYMRRARCSHVFCSGYKSEPSLRAGIIRRENEFWIFKPVSGLWCLIYRSTLWEASLLNFNAKLNVEAEISDLFWELEASCDQVWKPRNID